jgi:hypothetical protein
MKRAIVYEATESCWHARQRNSRSSASIERHSVVTAGIRSDTIATVPETKVNHGQTLSKVPIFAGLTEGELAFLPQHAVLRHYAAGEIVFGEGEPCLGLYVVESGHIRIFKSSSGGREHVLSVDGPGSSVAELPVFDGGN